MLVSCNWLKKFVDIPKSITPEKLAEVLTLSTVEVEKVTRQGALLDQVVVGKVLKIESHPNADKLKVVEVDVGSVKNPKSEARNSKQPQTPNPRIQKVVCGGANLRRGMKVAFAKVGACVKWHGEGEPMVLKKARIRGVASDGMICSASELELETLFPQESEYHIIDLSGFRRAKVGESLADALDFDDVIIEIENKSLTNRPDLWSHYGIAREIGALLKSKVKSLKPKVESNAQGEDNLKVEIRNNEKCSRYLGVVVDNIKIKPSPRWVVKQLEVLGVRPINNIVDITNYVLMELGQPLHAFDYRDICGHKIIVRNAKRGERMKTLDGQIRILEPDDLVIADPKRVVALAGVMGGANSEISDKTTKIIIESANFEASGIRRTEARTGLRTEASIRFEKALNPELAKQGIERALELILKLCPQAQIASAIIDAGVYKTKRQAINLDLEYLNRLVGESIPAKKVINILESLGFKLKHQTTQVPNNLSNSNVRLQIEVPPFRAISDITSQEDLIEEISRVYGYQNIKSELPEVKMKLPHINTERQLERQIKNILAIGFGFNETQLYSFAAKPDVVKVCGCADKLLEVVNPAAPEQSHLRPCLLVGLINSIARNLRYEDELKLFEIGRVFTNEQGQYNAKPGSKEFLPKQGKRLSGVIVASGKDVFYQTKEVVENLLTKLGVTYELQPPKQMPVWPEKNRALEIRAGQENIGVVAELNPKVASEFKISKRVGVFDFDFTLLAELPRRPVAEFQTLPIYPLVARDLAIVVGRGIQYKDIAELINGISPLIVEVNLFDIYEDEKIGSGKVSLAFHIIFQAPDRTLEAGEVDGILEKAVKKLGEKFGARIRDF